MAENISELRCIHCKQSSQPTGSDSTCAACGPTDGILEIRFDMEFVRRAWQITPLSVRPHSHWRYSELLPLNPSRIQTHWPVGWTPLIDATRLATELGITQLLLKDEGRNPTASMKDRASSVGVAHASERGAVTIACASTGNAATSLAGHAALAGMRAVIFVPQNVARPKLAQLLVYGATVFVVEGLYENAYRLCSGACDEYGWYNRNCAINPVLMEGKKTCGLEIAEQCLSHGGVPDWVVVSVGDGCTIAGIWKGLVEMHHLEIIDRLPRMLGVQAEGVAPVAFAFEHDKLPESYSASTLADGINVQTPRNWRKAVDAVRRSHGAFLQVTDDHILAAIAQTGKHGVFAEPAAAASVAGVQLAVESGILRPTDRVLAVITGSGLKDSNAAMQSVGEPFSIKPTLDAVAEALAMR